MPIWPMTGAGKLRDRLVAVSARARLFAFEMEFSFLLRQRRKLLSIGYRVDERQLDEACYDLLAYGSPAGEHVRHRQGATCRRPTGSGWEGRSRRSAFRQPWSPGRGRCSSI